MTHHHLQLEGVNQNHWPWFFPVAGAITMATATLPKQQSSVLRGKPGAVLTLPPAAKGSHCNLRRIGSNTNVALAQVVDHIVEAIGSGSNAGIRGESLHLDRFWFKLPGTPRLLEVANAFLLWSIDAQHWMSSAAPSWLDPLARVKLTVLRSKPASLRA